MKSQALVKCSMCEGKGITETDHPCYGPSEHTCELCGGTGQITRGMYWSEKFSGVLLLTFLAAILLVTLYVTKKWMVSDVLRVFILIIVFYIFPIFLGLLSGFKSRSTT